MSITLKKIKENFIVFPWENLNKDNLTAYNVYDKEDNSGKIQNHRFLGTIYYNSKKQEVIFNDVVYNNIIILMKALFDWAFGLPWCSDYYDPTYRVGYKEKYIIRDYLKALGFESAITNDWKAERFTLKGHEPYFGQIYIDISITVDDDATTGTIIQHSTIKDDWRWISESFSDLDEAIGKINSLIEPQILCTSAWGISQHNKLNDRRKKLNGYFNKFDFKTFETYTESTKDILIEKLENALKTLKGE